MSFRLLPKEFEFFDMFDKLASIAVDASLYFKSLTLEGNFHDQSISHMQDLEHAADDVTHDIINKLNKTFITPFDREDIHALAHEMDSIIDILLTLTNKMRIYKLTQPNQYLVQFSEIIESSVNALQKAIMSLRESKKPQAIFEYCIEVNRLENVGDQLRNMVIADLFENNKDPLYIIKWKEIIQDAETTLDQCEDVANIVQTILVKQA